MKNQVKKQLLLFVGTIFASFQVGDSFVLPPWGLYETPCHRTEPHCRSRPGCSSSCRGSVSYMQVSDDESIAGVTLKLAFDQNWGVAEQKEGVKVERFTSPASLDMVHRLRRDSDCVLVGKTTVLMDDCSLTVRRVPPRVKDLQPTRVILDSKLSLLPSDNNQYRQYQIFNDGHPTLVYFSMQALPPPEQIQMQLMMDTDNKSDIAWNPKVTLVNLDALSRNGADSVLSPSLILEDLQKRRGLEHVMVEGGPITAQAFLQGGLVDRAVIVKAPISFEEPVPSGIDHAALQKAGLMYLGSQPSDVDIIEYWSRPDLPWPGLTAHAEDVEGQEMDFNWP